MVRQWQFMHNPPHTNNVHACLCAQGLREHLQDSYGNGMIHTCKKTDSALHARQVMPDIQKMTVELNEHRYYLEQNVARRTEHLLKRIALLEVCNGVLCDKLASSQKALAALQITERYDN
jgi:hypothetical protein